MEQEWSSKARVVSIGSKALLSGDGDSEPQAERNDLGCGVRLGVGSAEIFEEAGRGRGHSLHNDKVGRAPLWTGQTPDTGGARRAANG
jgi:hypothetical protein